MSIPGSASPLFIGAAAAEEAAFQIDRSLRFNDGDSAYLNRTPSSAGNRRTWTWSGWVKRGELGNYVCLFGNEDYDAIQFRGTTKSELDIFFDGTNDGRLITSRSFRDVSAWYHIVVSCDTTQATASDRLKLYVNGVQETSFDSSTYPAQNYQTSFNATTPQFVGATKNTSIFRYFDGYLAEVHFVDGQQLAASDFGEYDDNNVWQPKEYSGTYGTNGFRLTFSDNSSNAALGTDSSGNSNTFTVNNLTAGPAVATGAVSGGTPANASGSGGWDQAFDGSTTTLVYNSSSGTTSTFTLHDSISWSSKIRIYAGQNATSGTNIIANGTNLSSSHTWPVAGGWQEVTSSLTSPLASLALVNVGGQSSNIRAVEIDDTIVVQIKGENVDSLIDTPTNYTAASGNNGGNYCTWNPLSNGAAAPSNGNLDLGSSSADTRCNSTISVSSGKWYYEITLTSVGSNSSAGIGQDQITNNWPGNDALSYAFELDNARTANNNTLTAYGSALGVGDVFMCAFDLDNNKIFFGKNGTFFNSSDPAAGTSPAFTLSAGSYCPIGRPYEGSGSGGSFSLNTGQRPFAYTPPTGFKSLCTQNLADPTIADGSTAFDAKLYTGNGSTQSITGFNFSPDFVWIKSRSSARSHSVFDIVRGATKLIKPNETQQETTQTGGVTSFDSNGFSMGSRNGNNADTETFVAWCWDGGTSTASNTDGSITSNVRANQTAGFSIVTHTGNGTNPSSIGHGLNSAPVFYITKSRDSATDWVVSTTVADGTHDFLDLNNTQAIGAFDAGLPTSSVFYVSGSTTNASGDDYVTYCWAPVEGYSAFGTYTGNGSNDGPFVFTGMRPAWLLIKNTTDSSDNDYWVLFDATRSEYNAADKTLIPNLNNAEGTTSHAVDFLSNGFKLRATHTSRNASGDNYIYAAFAEHPLRYARAR